MSGNLNVATLIGNLTRDPEIRTVTSGDKVANLGIATNESWFDKNSGEKKEKVEFHRVVIWGKLAEVCEKYLKKGSKVYVSGTLETRKWSDKDGQDKYSTEIVLRGFDSKFIMLDGKPGSNTASVHDEGKANGYQPQSGGWEGGGSESPKASSSKTRAPIDNMNDEIPF